MRIINTVRLQPILSSQKNKSLMPLSMLILMILLKTSWIWFMHKVLVLRPLYGWASIDTIERTCDVTTQYASGRVSGTL
jgi:hypothetical protein